MEKRGSFHQVMIVFTSLIVLVLIVVLFLDIRATGQAVKEENYTNLTYELGVERVFPVGDYFQVAKGIPTPVSFRVTCVNGPCNNFNNSIVYAGTPTILWEKTFGSLFDDDSQRVEVDDEDDIFLAGGFGLNPVQKAFFAGKYDNNGEPVWNKSIISGLTDIANGVTVSEDDRHVYFVGDYGLNNLYTVKYNVNGTEIWSDSYLWGDVASALDIEEEINGSVYTGGYVINLPTSSSFVLIKYNHTDGDPLWNRSYDVAPAIEVLTGLEKDSNWEGYITGYLDTTVTTDLLGVAKINYSGNPLWFALDFVGAQEGRYTDLVLDTNEIPSAAGYFRMTPATNYVTIVRKYNPLDGSSLLNFSINDTKETRDLEMDKSDNSYITGLSLTDEIDLMRINEFYELDWKYTIPGIYESRSIDLDNKRYIYVLANNISGANKDFYLAKLDQYYEITSTGFVLSNFTNPSSFSLNTGESQVIEAWITLNNTGYQEVGFLSELGDDKKIFSSNYFNFNVTPIGVILNSPAEGENFDAGNITFNYSVFSENNVLNCSLNVVSGDTVFNQSVVTSSNLINHSFVNGSYSVFVNCSDVLTDYYFSKTVSFTVGSDGSGSSGGRRGGGSTGLYSNDCNSTGYDWNCSAWSECIDSVKTRNCNEMDNCGNNSERPATKESCKVEASNFGEDEKVEINFEDEPVKKSCEFFNINLGFWLIICWYWWILIIILIILVLICWRIYRHFNKKKRIDELRNVSYGEEL